MIIRRKNLLYFILYILFLLTYYFLVSKIGMGAPIANIRYYFMFALTVIGLIILAYRTKLNGTYSNELLLTILVGLFFLVTSKSKADSVGYALDIRTFVQIFLIVCPSLMAYTIINNFSIHEIINFMKVTTIITILGYFMESSHSPANFFSISNLAPSKLFSNGSILESSMCSEVFVQLYCFFNYFKNMDLEDTEKKSLKFYLRLTFCFAVMSFKRLAIVFCILLPLICKFIKYKSGNYKNRYIITAIIFTVLTVLYSEFMQGEIFTNVDVFTFSTGRDYILSLWKNYNYFSYGYGTSMLLIGRYLEMDLVQIYMEIGLLSVFIICLVYFKIADRNNYTYIIMLYSFLNLLTASSFPLPISWIILFITVGVISSDKLIDEEVKIEKETIRFKFK